MNAKSKESDEFVVNEDVIANTCYSKRFDENCVYGAYRENEFGESGRLICNGVAVCFAAVYKDVFVSLDVLL